MTLISILKVAKNLLRKISLGFKFGPFYSFQNGRLYQLKNVYKFTRKLLDTKIQS